MLVQTIEFKTSGDVARQTVADHATKREGEHGILQYCFVVEVTHGTAPMFEVRAIWLRAAGPLQTGERLVRHAVHMA